MYCAICTRRAVVNYPDVGNVKLLVNFEIDLIMMINYARSELSSLGIELKSFKSKAYGYY